MSAIQIKSVPDDLHGALRERAHKQGVTLSEYVLALLRRDLARPTLDEWFEGVEQRTPVDLGGIDVAEAIREAHADRDEQLTRAVRS